MEPARAEAGPLPGIADDVDMEQALPHLSNWGRWGSDDQLGTLNFMTGRIVPLGREVSTATAEL